MKNKRSIFLQIVAITLVFVCASFVSDVSDRPLAPNFTLENAEGVKVSLSDYKGKVIYIDFWATWCGPCLAEMPYSKKLREQFVGNDSIVFMYVSVDNEDDMDHWKSVLKKKDIVGVNLIARNGGEEERVGERYGLQYIPKFVLVDKKGGIATFNAPAPSDPKASQIIKQLLAE